MLLLYLLYGVAKCIYSLRVREHDLRLSTHCEPYLTVIFCSDILSFKATAEPKCGRSTPQSVGKVPRSVQSVEE